MAAVLGVTKGDVFFNKVTRTKKINRWGYRIEIIIRVSQDNLKEMAELIELPNGLKLTIVLERRFPSCYFCREGSILRKCVPNLCKGMQRLKHGSAKQKRKQQLEKQIGSLRTGIEGKKREEKRRQR